MFLIQSYLWQQRAGLTILVPLIGLLASCDKATDHRARNVPEVASTLHDESGSLKKDEKPTSFSVEDPPMEVPFSVGHDDELAVFQFDDWASERWNERIDQQLKVLAKILVHGVVDDDHESLANLVAGAFRCHSLRSSVMSVVFEDQGLVVRRPSDNVTDPAHEGVEGLAIALAALLKPVGEEYDIHVKFKTIRVSPTTDGAITVSNYQLAGTSSQGSIQQTATWRCRWLEQDGGAPRLAEIAASDYEESQSKSGTKPLFADCTEAALASNQSYQEQMVRGVDHWLGSLETIYGILSSGWTGIAVADVNGDGLDDLYSSQPGGLTNRLYLQQPDGTLKDASKESRLDYWDHTHSALFVDLDNDGDQDATLATALGLLFLENDGAGRFRVAAAKLAAEARPICVTAADFDDDGDLDIHTCCYSLRGSAVARSYGLLGRPIPFHDANNGGRNIMYRNDGQWNFRDVTKQVGLGQNNQRFSLAAAWEDYDNDGDVDLYVANDFGRNNLYRNDNGRFLDVAASAGVEDMSAGMSVTWSDFNNDGWMDLYISNMFSSAGNRVTYQNRFLTDVDEETRSGFQRHARGNALFLNSGDGQTFHDVSLSAGVTLGRWAWASMFADINNDTHDDLIVANGFITTEDPGDL